MNPLTHFNWNTIVIGITTSFIASIFFLIFLALLKPKIKISRYVCTNQYNGKQRWQFKIVNYSFWKVYDVKAYLKLIRPYNVDSGQNGYIDYIKLRKDSLPHISGIFSGGTLKTYAVQLSTFEDVAQLLDDNSKYLQLEIVGRHAFSGFSKVFVKKFGDKDVFLKKGKFQIGRKTDVIKTDNQ